MAKSGSGLELGQRIQYVAELHRTQRDRDGGQEKSWERLPFTREGEGVVVGLRRLQNGYTLWGGYDESTSWHQTESVPAVLVAVSLYEKPILVHIEDVRA